MATRNHHSSSVNDDANALCYVWLTFALLILSSVCFATSAADSTLVYAGIFFLACAFITATAYVTRYFARRQCDVFCLGTSTSNNDCCCTCCQRCCNRCWRTILCLQSSNTSPTLAISRRDRHRISMFNSTSALPHRAAVSSSGEIFIVPIEEDTISYRIHKLEREIHRLRQQYEFLQRQECVDTVVEQDYLTLDQEEAKLLSWKENNVPSELQLKSMKGRLKRIARNFRLARSRLYHQNHGVHANMENDLQLAIDMDAPEQVRVFAADIPLPPAYSEEDPEPASTLRHSAVVSITPAYTSRDVAVNNDRSLNDPEPASTLRHSAVGVTTPAYTSRDVAVTSVNNDVTSLNGTATSADMTVTTLNTAVTSLDSTVTSQYTGLTSLNDTMTSSSNDVELTSQDVIMTSPNTTDVNAPSMTRFVSQSVYTVHESHPSTSPSQTVSQSRQNGSLTPIEDSHNGSHNIAPPTTPFVPSHSGAYQNAAFLGHLSGSSESLAPPTDDRGAPPSYAEATASPV